MLNLEARRSTSGIPHLNVHTWNVDGKQPHTESVHFSFHSKTSGPSLLIGVCHCGGIVWQNSDQMTMHSSPVLGRDRLHASVCEFSWFQGQVGKPLGHRHPGPVCRHISRSCYWSIFSHAARMLSYNGLTWNWANETTSEVATIRSRTLMKKWTAPEPSPDLRAFRSFSCGGKPWTEP